MGAELLVIAFDPGPTTCGLAVVQRTRGSARFISASNIPSTQAAVREALATSGASIVAVETPSGFIHQHARGAQLLATARIAGMIVGQAAALGLATLEMSAQDWRRPFCGGGHRGVPGDAAVKAAIRVFVTDVPKRTNTHVRDAIALATVASWNHLKAKVPA
jgi:Holliday junction resolvasome RuvABC endonuclease subunit